MVSARPERILRAMSWSFSRRSLLFLVAGGVVVLVGGFGASAALGDAMDPLSPSNPATLAGAIGLLLGVGLEVVAKLGNHCPQCGAEMKHLLQDGGRVGVNVPVLDYTARECHQCGHVRA